MTPALLPSQDLAAVLNVASQLTKQAGRLFSSQLHRRRLTLLRIGLCFVVFWSWILYFILAYVVPASPTLVPASLLFASRPLLVTAHPDDESLFFGPTILSLTQDERKALSILVLSCGNNYGFGSTRKDEMKKACKRLGARDCTVLDMQSIQDSPTQWWDEDAIVPLVRSHITKVRADAVITFDAGGISGHINHRAVSSALVKHAVTEPSLPPVFILRTVPTFLPPRKYIGVYDLPLTSTRFTFRILRALFLSDSAKHAQLWKSYDDKGLIVSSLRIWFLNVRAFWEHSSQRNWDRWLYVLVNRYMWFNDIEKVLVI